MVGTNQNYYMNHENERKNLILFSDSRKKNEALIKFFFFFMIKNLSISSSLIPDKQRGSVESQVFFLTNRVLRLTQHLQLHGRDYSSQRGLWLILSKRKQLLVYLSKRDKLRYDDLIGQLSIRRLKTR
nr:ribosomal protein S15 [Pinus morrisonicola]AXR86294.1 ribosomal protein S15 [Pinus morrisonicola]